MKETKLTFQRLEKKYLLTAAQYTAIMARLSPYLKEDEFGCSTISNIYYDTIQYDLITHSLQKPMYKEKLRVRSYGSVDVDSTVYIEIKKKYKGVVNKRRVGMLLEDAQRYLQLGYRPALQSQILSEIDYFLKFYNPVPKVFLAYDRSPFVGIEDSELRITFDHNIRRRYEHLSLGDGDYGECVLPKGVVLMEIKVADAYPLWLVTILSDLMIYPISFSKYGKVFMEDVVKERMVLCSQV